MHWLRGIQYEKVGESDSETDFEAPRRRDHSFRTKLVAHFNLGFFVVNIIFLAATLWTYSQQKTANWILQQANSYSPIIEQFDFSFHKEKQNASLFNDPYSIYKADPSSEVDAAWEEVSDTPVLVLTREEIIKIGKDPDYTAAVPEEFGYGKDKFFGVMDGQHLLHCLDEVRKFAHYDYYYREKWGDMSNIPMLHAAHRSHCIGVLFEALRCQPSVNVVTFEWMEGQPEPYPDFNIIRQCQNTNQLFDWTNKNQVPREKIKAWGFPKPKDAKEVPMLPQMKNIGNGTSISHEHSHSHDNP